MIVALAGGVGGARLAVGLTAVLPPSELTIVVNTADDFEHHGLSISPDLDTVMYTLAGIANPVLGWGRADETWNFMSVLGALGGESWFRLGDRDLAVHVLRTELLRKGVPLSEITRRLMSRLAIEHPVIPMSDSPVRTRVRTSEGGELAFQDYFVRLQCKPRVTGFRFAGSRKAHVPPELRRILQEPVEAVVICPSNPYVSVAPILSVGAIRTWLRKRTFPVLAVSPIVGGAAIKGPAAKMMRELGADSTALGVARHYGDLVDGWVIDKADEKLQGPIEREGRSVLVTDTIMKTRARSVALAKRVVEFARSQPGHSPSTVS
ncbi:MAG: 2-phospho-L-lactate transferase [Burkholderiales bacterium]